MKGKVGIGLRRDISEEILESKKLTPDFLEFAPENWMGVGGNWKRTIKKAVSSYPITCHGLSLSLGSPEELNWEFIGELKNFLDAYNFAKRLKTLKGLTVFEFITMKWTKEPERFKINPNHLTSGPYI